MNHLKLFEDFDQKEKFEHLLIVDVQKSFSKYFTDNYVEQLKKYAEKFQNVYQLWDNHVQGPNVDKDYLYDEKPKIPKIKDIIKFPNEKLRIEKRYNYDVDVDFYKKILKKDIFEEIKEKEKNKQLKRGDFFYTTEGTIIVYIGNQHVWYHVPIKLYNLFVKLKGVEVTLVGGSLGECLLDVETAAKSLGVNLVANKKYIYSASYCPIK